MDLRTIINTDSNTNTTGGAPRNPNLQQRSPEQPIHPSPLQRRPSVHDPLRRGSIHDVGSPVSHQIHPEYGGGKPPQPLLPLQPPLQPSPKRSNSYGSIQSPYQQPLSAVLPTISPSTGREPLHLDRAAGIQHRDSFPYPSTLPQPTGSLSSPFTPQPISASAQQSYFSQQRSHSIHSAASPSSVRSLTYPPPREPVGTIQHQTTILTQPYSPGQQRSQPGTPLAPPSGQYGAPSSRLTRSPASSHSSHQHTVLGGQWGNQDASEKDIKDEISPTVHTPHSRHGNDQLATEPPFRRHYSIERDREYFGSVSPKTTVKNLTTPQRGHYGDNIVSSGHARHTPQRDVEMTGQANHSTVEGGHDPARAATATAVMPSYPPSTPKTSHLPIPQNRITTTFSPTSHRPMKGISPTMPDTQETPARIPSQAMSSDVGAARPRKKRKRYLQPPIFACKAHRSSGMPPPIPSHTNPPLPYVVAPKGSLPNQDIPPEQNAPPAQISLPSRPPVPMQDTGNRDVTINGSSAVPRIPEPARLSSLGPWEPSITGLIPHEETTKIICDFLFKHVVIKKELGAGPAGGAAIGSGAIIEVEAKLGRLIDKNRRERIRLPVLTECVISKEDPSLKLQFESSMSLAQHKSLNEFLNEAVKKSLMPGANRIPLAYAHKRELDTFYEISASALPPVVQHHLHHHHKPKVRVTTDAQTGAVLARIVKCRIADLDVHSPRTFLDWRISVNLEMNYEGDVSQLQQVSDSRRGADRNKDRMSYRHLAYQIDLTQVGSSDNTSNFDHELEIEISAAEIRRQGEMALSGDASHRYEDLIKGFVDNVRVLARAVPAQ
ncbi:mRNA-capping enzyme subunit beta [Myotisia sp. PD_48]|nr:mRNA-capping enzyme subunit beta [Myotisia sp. PD_48]